MRGLLVFLLVALLARESVQRGTLYLNEIQAIQDAITLEETLPIECTLWEDNLVYLDNFDALFSPGIGEGSGVDVDGALLDLGTWVFPNDFNVAGTVTINGLLQVNGGFFADDGDFGDADGDDLDWAFEVEDDSGRGFIAGSLTIEGSINNSKNLTNPDGTFVVNAVTGETTISGLLRPNGGIDINNGVVTVGSDGEFFVSGDAVIRQDLILGTERSEITELIPYTNGPGTSPNSGADTTLKGQDARDIGGHIVLVPGTGIGAQALQETGDIIIGVENQAHDLLVARYDAQVGNAGDFHFGGQESTGKGGDILIRAGDSFASTGTGGNIIFSPGISSSTAAGFGVRGFFYLGDPNGESNIPFFVERPEVSNSRRAGHTFLTGQNVTSGNAGETIIRGGDGTLSGGNIYLEPGMNGPRQGKIFFGSANPGSTTLRLTRDTDPHILDAGSTWFIGQDSAGGDGGDIYLEAGRGTSGRNGNLYLSPGSSAAGQTSGTIFWGTNVGNRELRIVRPDSVDNPAHDMTIHGADSTAGVTGGELFLVGGSGLSGGDVHIDAGFGEEDYGGEVIIQGGNGAAAGGNIVIRSGASDSTVTGDIFFTAGDGAFGADAGSVFITAINNDVTFDAAELLLDSIPFFYDRNQANAANTDFQIRANGNILSIAPNVSGNGFFNLVDGGSVSSLLTDRISLTENFRPITNPYDALTTAAEEFRQALAELRNGLIQHDLISTP